MIQHTENEISSHSSISSWDNSAVCTCAKVITCALDRWEQCMENMIFIVQYAAKESIISSTAQNEPENTGYGIILDIILYRIPDS